MVMRCHESWYMMIDDWWMIVAICCCHRRCRCRRRSQRLPPPWFVVTRGFPHAFTIHSSLLDTSCRLLVLCCCPVLKISRNFLLYGKRMQTCWHTYCRSMRSRPNRRRVKQRMLGGTSDLSGSVQPAASENYIEWPSLGQDQTLQVDIQIIRSFCQLYINACQGLHLLYTSP